MAAASNATIYNYEYMNEAQIDDELKCPICKQPFQKPVSLACQHTFCQNCVEIWLHSHKSCPICRRSTGTHKDRNGELWTKIFGAPIFTPVNTSIVINQLDRLLVRCNQCQMTNIQRGNFTDHESTCAKKIVPCPSAVIQCRWMGPRDEQAKHLKICPFQRIRPIIEQLQDQLQQQSDQINFLLAVINKGNSMSKECKNSESACRCALNRQQKHDRITFQCNLCKNTVRHNRVSLHACSSSSPCDCICRQCYKKQYCPSEYDHSDDDDDDDDDDN